MKYEVTINCTLTQYVEAVTAAEAEVIAREDARIGDAAIVWVGVDRADSEDEKVA